MKKTIRTFAVASAAALLFSACSEGAASNDTQDDSNAGGSSAECTPMHEDLETISEGVLTVAQYAYEPYSVYENGELTGVEGEILTRFAELQCLDIEVVQGNAASMITSVETGRADTTLGSWYRTKDRAKVVRQSQPIIESYLAIVSKHDASTVDDLQELQFGVTAGLIGVEDMSEVAPNTINIYQSSQEYFEDLRVGRIDAVVTGYGRGMYELEQHSIEGATLEAIEPDERIPATLEPGQTNFPTNLNNDSLGEAIDEVLADLREEGFIADVAEKYGYPREVAQVGEPREL